MRQQAKEVSFDAYEPTPWDGVPFEDAERLDALGDDGLPRRMVILAVLNVEGDEVWMLADEREVRRPKGREVSVHLYQRNAPDRWRQVEDRKVFDRVHQAFAALVEARKRG